METFKRDGKEYQIAVRTQKSIIGINNESCCTEIIDFRTTGVYNIYWAPKVNPYPMIAKIAALSCKNLDHKCLVGDEQKSSSILSDHKTLMTLESTNVPGTSSGSIYRKIAETDKGYIARREADGLYNPRIRIVNPGYLAWPPHYEYVNKDTGAVWETIDKGHISSQGGVVDRAILLIARGLDILLRM